jgi:outer membrane protein assembly factor BamB
MFGRVFIKRMSSNSMFLLHMSLCLCFVLGNGSPAMGNWPQWRGPQANGTSPANAVPLTWGPQENLVWQTPMPSWSGSTPVVWDEHIFVVSPSGGQGPLPVSAEPRELFGSRGERDPGGDELLLLCLAAADGRELWRRVLDQGNQLHLKHNNASPSPVTDGHLVWAVSGNGAVVAFDMTGKEVWRHDLQKEYGPFGLMWGYASSPLLHQGRLIVQVLHGQKTDDPSYLVAFEADSGKVLWRQERVTDAVAESPDAYSTPVVLDNGGMAQVVVSGADYVTGHDPASGAELWRLGGLNPKKEGNYRIIASPLLADGMLFVPTRKRPLLALRFDDGKAELAWTWDGPAAPDVPSPVSDGHYLYLVDDRGRVVCLLAATGEVVWGPVRTAQGTVSASPVLAADRLYITNENGETTVLKAGPTFEKLASNQLDGSYTLSSAAIAGGRIFIRTATSLYCIGTPEGGE